MPPTPRQEIARAIARWESLFQAQPQDAGNYVNGRLVGTMRGVTPAVLAAHRGVPAVTITEADMRTVTLEEASEIGETRFYRGTGLDMLAWGPATAALMDVGWGSGPRQAVLFAQRLAGTVDDGVVGPATVAAYAAWVNRVGWEEATRAVNKMRLAFYDAIIARNPQREIYRKGWANRANWQLPGGEWWRDWAADMPPPPQQQPVVAPLTPQPVATPASATPTKSLSITGAAAGGVGIVEAIGQASGQVQAANSTMGVVKWALIALALGGVLYAVWRIYRDRQAA